MLISYPLQHNMTSFTFLYSYSPSHEPVLLFIRQQNKPAFREKQANLATKSAHMI